MCQETIGVGMIGCGTVGGAVASLLRENAELYATRAGVRVELRRVLVRDTAKACRSGAVTEALVTDDAEAFFATPDMPIVIENAGGRGTVAGYVRRALEAGKHIVTANKSLLASEGPELFALARQHNACIAFEASCGGGIPVVTALQFGLMANRITGLYGILNGTCNFILTQMAHHGTGYEQTLAEAQAKGFAEADPTLDVSGRDAAEKLAVLASLAFGLRCSGDDVWCEGIDGLDLADIRCGAELGYDIKLLAIAELDEDGGDHAVSLRTHPCFIPVDRPLAQVRGAYNALSVYGDALGHSMYYGQGAGGMPTASAVVSDLLNVASGWYPKAFAQMRLTPDCHATPRLIEPRDVSSRYYLRINAKDAPGVLGRVSTILGERGISISSVLQHEQAAGQFVPVVITTNRAKQGDLDASLQQIERLSVIDGRPVCIRIVDLPTD